MPELLPMTVRSRCALLAIIVAVAFPPLVVAVPSAAAQPGCDWNTDAGTQACLGGGSFDAGKNGNGDTYGPSGEAGFVYDTRLILQSARALPDTQLLALGHGVCDRRREGNSEDRVTTAVADVFATNGLVAADAGYFVIDAEMYLCPGRLG
jgi:hypothetical protein